MTKPNSIGRKYIQADFNYILNAAKQAKDQAQNLRERREEIRGAIQVLDKFELTCLDTIKELTGKDLHYFAMEHNYGRGNK